EHEAQGIDHGFTARRLRNETHRAAAYRFVDRVAITEHRHDDDRRAGMLLAEAFERRYAAQARQVEIEENEVQVPMGSRDLETGGAIRRLEHLDLDAQMGDEMRHGVAHERMIV